MRFTRLVLAAFVGVVAPAPVAVAAAAPMVLPPQVIVLDHHVVGFLASIDEVLAELRLRGFQSSTHDLRGRVEQFQVPFADIQALAGLDEIVRARGFESYRDWVRVARSVLVTENWISHPPTNDGMETAISALKGDPFLTDNDRAKLISALRSTVGPRQAAPLRINIETVRPHVAAIKKALAAR